MIDYPTNLDVRPLTMWPGPLTPPGSRQRSPFSAPLRGTLTLLARELDMIGAARPVLEVAIPAAQFRVDGRPYARAQAEHPGVVLSLPRTDVGALRYATDRYDTWQDNLRAVALGMEALRKVDRYGITRRHEQYAGFRALPPGTPMPPAAMTVEDAARFLAEHGQPDGGAVFTAERLLADRPEWAALAYRTAARRLHPDAGGKPEDFHRLQEAKRLVDTAASPR
jgi:hypothetical protein